MKKINLLILCVIVCTNLMQSQDCKFKKEKADPFKKDQDQNKTIVIGDRYYITNYNFLFNMKQTNCNYTIELKLWWYGGKFNFILPYGSRFDFKLENGEIITLYTAVSSAPQFSNMGLKQPTREPNPALGDAEYNWETYWFPVIAISKTDMEKLSKSPLIVYKTDAFATSKSYIEDVKKKYRDDIMESAKCMLSVYCASGDSNSPNSKSNTNNSVKDGSFENKYTDGTLKEKGQYKNGYKIGLWKMYRSSGNLEDIVHFDVNGLKDSISTHYEQNGKVSFRTEYKQDMMNGKHLSYQDNGLLKEETNYVNGKRQGTSIEYNNKGMKYHEGLYNNDQKEGKWLDYDFVTGKFVKTTVYKNGSIQP